MWMSVIYCSYFNTAFLVPQLSEASWSQILRFIFPMVMIITGMAMWNMKNAREGDINRMVFVPKKIIFLGEIHNVKIASVML